MIELTDKKALEHHFAEHFDSPVFPVLADIYFESGDILRAKKVCEIGLAHHPGSIEGKFILAKVELVEDNLAQAEKWLKEIVENSQIHLNAMKLLIEVQTALGRSIKTIYTTVEKIVNIFPDDEESLQWIDKNNNEISRPEEDVQTPETEPASALDKTGVKSKITRDNDSRLVIDHRMATMTLAKVFRRQKNYIHALSVLEIVENKGGDLKRIEKERDEIYKLIKEQEPHT